MYVFQSLSTNQNTWFINKKLDIQITYLGSTAETIEDVLSGPDKIVMDGIQRGIDKYNARATSNAQRIQKWTILPADFSIPGGEIGPTMKV